MNKLNLENGFKIPIKIFDLHLTIHELVVYSYFFKCANNNYPTYKEISCKAKISKRTTQKAVSGLLKNKYIRKLTDLEKFNYLNSKNLNNSETGFIKCAWCKINTNIIHEHHYPISRSNGGNNVVKICPNCHSDFHASLFTINNDMLKNL